MGLRQLRLEAQEKARQIIPALFVEMFGDPAANPKGWPRVPFGDLVTIKAQLRKPDIRAEGHFACFGPEAIESRTGRLLAYGAVSECQPKSGKYLFSENEVLYSKIPPYLAKAAIVTDKGYCSADMYPLSCMKIAVPEFVLSLLLSQAFLLHAKLDFDGLRPAWSDTKSAEILELFGFSGTRSGQGHSGS